MQKLFLILLLTNVFLFNCKYPTTEKLTPVIKLLMASAAEEQQRAEASDYTKFTWGSFKDNDNGTVAFTGTNGTVITFLKCSQGQTYNSSTKSCDGTAGTYQFCSADTNDCSGNDATKVLGDSFLNGATSTAYNTCNGVGTFADKTGWRVPTKSDHTLPRQNDASR